MNAKNETENLMNELYDFAEKMLKEYGEFHPFGGYLDGTKRVVQVGVDAKDLAGTSEIDRLNMLLNSFKVFARENAGIAFSLVTNVSLPVEDGDHRDAIKFFLEHKQKYCADVFFVYRVTPQNTVEIIEIFAQAGTPMFFVD